MGKFSGKNFFIVGGSSGIGLSLTKQLLEQGAMVFMASRSIPSELEGVGVTYMAYDVTNPDVTKLEVLPEQLDGFVYCPGSINLKPFQRLSLSDFTTDFQVNVLGAIQILQSILPRLKKSPSASVVLYSTVASTIGMNFHASVATSKSALEGLAKSLAAEYATSKIRFNVIAPSLTNTPLAKQLLSTLEKIEASDKRHPLGRIGQASEIASITAFLLSDESAWMTGQIIHADGGMSSVKMV